MGRPDEIPEKKIDSISKRPDLSSAKELWEILGDTLEADLGSVNLAVSESNPYVDKLLKFADSLSKGKFENNEPDLNHISHISHKDGVLSFHYEHNPELDFSYKKGDDVYEAIFWRKSQKEAKVVESSKKSRDDISGELDLGKEDKESVEAKFKEQLIEDPSTGYRIKLYVPEGFNGKIDLYFPGDTYDIEKSINKMGLEKKFKSRLKKGDKAGFAIVEGNKEAINKNKKERYKELKAPGVFNKMMNSIESSAGEELKSIHIMGFSRGGSAINNILENDTASRVEHISCLDSTYWSSVPLTAFARRGGRLDIAFKKGEKTEGPALKLIKDLGLKKIASGHWQSEDGRVNVYREKKMSHSDIAKNYAGIFMDAEEGDNDSMYGDNKVTDEDKFEVYAEANAQKPGEIHGVYIDRINELKEKSPELVKKDEQRIRDANIEDVRFNSRFLNEKKEGEDSETQKSNIKDETRRRMLAYTSSFDGKWYTLDYAKMGSDSKGRSHEKYVGLGDVIIDPDVQEIVVDRGGEIIHAVRGKVQRGKHRGRIGFVEKETGKYVYSHTGDRFRILTNNSDKLETEQYLSIYRDEDSVRAGQRKEFVNENSYSSRSSKFAHDPGYVAMDDSVGEFIDSDEVYEHEESYHKVKRLGGGERYKLGSKESRINKMGYKQGLRYWERLAGRPPSSKWKCTRRSADKNRESLAAQGFDIDRDFKVFGQDFRKKRGNIIIAVLMMDLEDKMKKTYREKFGKELDLRYNYMGVKDSSGGYHGLGMAVDFEPKNNWCNSPDKTKWNLPLAQVLMMQREGWGWGWTYKIDGYKTDAMHFDYRGTLPSAIRQLSSPRAIALAKGWQSERGMSLYDYGMSLSGKRH